MAFGGGLQNLNHGQLATLMEYLDGGLRNALKADERRSNDEVEEKQVKQSIEKQQLAKQEVIRLLEKPSPELSSKLAALGIELNKEMIGQLAEGFAATLRQSGRSPAAGSELGKSADLGAQLLGSMARNSGVLQETAPLQRDHFVRLGVGQPNAQKDFPELRADHLAQAQKTSQQSPSTAPLRSGQTSAPADQAYQPPGVKQKTFTLPDGQVVALNGQGEIIPNLPSGKMSPQLMGKANPLGLDAATLAQLRPGMRLTLPDGRNITMDASGQIVTVPEHEGFESGKPANQQGLPSSTLQGKGGELSQLPRRLSSQLNPSHVAGSGPQTSLLPGGAGQWGQLKMLPTGGFEAHFVPLKGNNLSSQQPTEQRFVGTKPPWQVDGQRFQQLVQQGMRPEQALATLQAQGAATLMLPSEKGQAGTIQYLRDGEFVFMPAPADRIEANLHRNSRGYRVAVAERFSAAMAESAKLASTPSNPSSTSPAATPPSGRPGALQGQAADGHPQALLANLMKEGGVAQLMDGVRQMLSQGGLGILQANTLLMNPDKQLSELQESHSAESLLEDGVESSESSAKSSRQTEQNTTLSVLKRQQAVLNARRAIVGAGNVFGGSTPVQDSKITSATIEEIEAQQGEVVDFAALVQRFPDSPALRLQRMFRFADVAMQTSSPPTMLDLVDDMFYNVVKAQLEGNTLPGVHALLSLSRDDMMATVRELIHRLVELPHPRDAHGREIPLSVTEMEAQLVAFAQHDLPTLARIIRQSSSANRQVLLGIWASLPDFLASLQGKPNQELQDRIGHLGRFCLELRMAQLAEQPGVALQQAFQEKSLEQSIGRIWSHMEPPLATFLQYSPEQELPKYGAFAGYDSVVYSQVDMQKVGVGLSNGLVLLLASGGLTSRDKVYAHRYLDRVHSKLYDEDSSELMGSSGKRLRTYAGPNDAKVGFERLEAVPLIIL